MATKHGMIEPFEPNQIKHANGRKIVSYGTSSYGYDTRCSDEFKLFTNINSTIVDPKNFDSNSFVDVKKRCMHHSTQFFCISTDRRVFPHSTQRPYDLSW